MSEQWYWCLVHETAEPSGACPVEGRLGPYASREEAIRWKDRHEGRSDTWQAEEEQAKDAWDREDEAWEAWPED
jgi:hypothetical protein